MKAKYGAKCIEMNKLAHIPHVENIRGIRGNIKNNSYSLIFSYIPYRGIRSKYIIIIYLQLIFPLTLPHYPCFENMNYTNKLEDGE